jgi:predicted Rossmann-fold nucleotide-binding protein
MSSTETAADSDKELRTLASICIYCGSSPGVSPTFSQKAAELGQEMARRNIRLVYGGGNIGLMGAVSSACEKG